ADPERAGRILGELRAMGLELAVDDFGTGYSSLAYPRRLPVTCLKIDRAFVGDMDIDEGNATIVSAIVEMANTLRLEITAEGGARLEVRALWRRRGGRGAQASLFSRPRPAAELAAWARANADATVGTATIAAPTPSGTPAPRAARTRSTGR